MHKNIDALLLLLAAVFLCAVLPLRCVNRHVVFLEQRQHAYEADYLAWEIRTFQRIDSSVLPPAAIRFYCYDRNLEQAAVLSSADDLDFSTYFCVIFTYNGEKRGFVLNSRIGAMPGRMILLLLYCSPCSWRGVLRLITGRLLQKNFPYSFYRKPMNPA